MASKKQFATGTDSDEDVGDTNENTSFEENDNSRDSEAEEEISDTNENGLTNSGWADSVSKILKLNKPKGKKAVVLSKAKKLTDVKKEKSRPIGFEVQTVGGEIKEEKVEVSELELRLKEQPPRKKKRTASDFRVKPNILEKDRERTLQKIATKGVVQLFNAVKSQQKQISEKLKEAGPLEVRKEKVLKNIDKRAFLDVLMGEKSQKIDDFGIAKPQFNSTDLKKSEENNTVWSVLKDDFMLSAKMKDWDKEIEDPDEVQNVDVD